MTEPGYDIHAGLERQPGPAVLLDRDGAIRAANAAWRETASAIGAGPGASYLEIFRAATTSADETSAISAGIEDVLQGRRAAFGLDCSRALPGAPGRLCTVLCPPAPGGSLITHVYSSARFGAGALAGSVLCDELTGLANRRMLLDRVESALAAGRHVGVLFLDLDDFKLVNDGFGHAAGDKVLVEVAHRLSRAVRPLDLVARLGGDEFAVACEDIGEERDLLNLAARLQKVLADPFDVAGRARHVRASIGCRLLGDEELPPAEAAGVLVSDADVAMYEAKVSGKDRVEVFSAATRARLAQASELEADLRRAMETDELAVHYQPHVDLMTGRVVGAEALLRWTHPLRGPISPCEFIPLAERSGLIVPLGDRVVAQACRDLARWHAAGHGALAVSVNVAVLQLSDTGFADRVAASAAAAGVDPRAMCLEVTESTLMGTDGAGLDTLHALRALGAYVAIDDFGTGYSSLSYLKRLPVEVLKVDRTFVDGLGTDEGDTAIVGSVMSLAHAMGLHVVAEGVETRLQAEELLALGCTVAQGFLFSAAVPAARIPELAAAWATTRVRGHTGRRAAPRFVDEFMQQLGLPEELA